MRTARVMDVGGIRERKTTEWHNPTKKAVSVVLHDESNRPFRFVVEPGETKALDSAYDRALQTVDCGRKECHDRPAGGHFCNAGHPGQIQGGLAPQLQRVGKDDELLDVLNVPLVEKQQLEALVVASSQTKEIQSSVATRAVGRLKELDAEIEERAASKPSRRRTVSAP